MCTTCGCGGGESVVAGKVLTEPDVAVAGDTAPPVSVPLRENHAGSAVRATYRAVAASHGHAHHHPHAHDAADHDHHHEHGQETANAAAMTASRMVQIERAILAKNDGYAAGNRRRFEEQGIFALNLVSSPGSGKTTLLCRTIEALKERISIAVIEGDQQTSRDAERIRATGVSAVQINTGKGCHLDAHMVGHALEDLTPGDDSLLLIENVGNLVCPAAFDLGEAHKVVILSVTEGEDKPLKYPNMFHAASMMLLNKVDLLPYVSFNTDLAISYARQVNPALQVVQLSATTGEGFAEWLDWLTTGSTARQEKRRLSVAALRRQVADLEAKLAAAAGG